MNWLPVHRVPKLEWRQGSYLDAKQVQTLWSKEVRGRIVRPEAPEDALEGAVSSTPHGAVPDLQLSEVEDELLLVARLLRSALALDCACPSSI
ncbi:hypothetical protein D3C71_1660090 [compost metagenome]